MFSIVGVVVVFGAILGGYLMEQGKIAVLLQPSELIIIAGAATGALLIANPLPVILSIVKGLKGVFLPSRYSKKLYLETLKMLNDLFMRARKNGLTSLEPDVEQPETSEFFKSCPSVSKDRRVLAFICDTLRMAMTGAIAHHELDQMIEVDLEVQQADLHAPVGALNHIADSLPGFGIVAAVLGVVVTMQSLGGAPALIGQKVAAALVGTFLGILLCYGLLSPLAANMNGVNHQEAHYYHCLHTGLIAFLRGSAPIVAIEFSRRSIPAALRPGFQEMEDYCRGRKSGEAAAEGGAQPNEAADAAGAAEPA
ncbi:MAG TPA: flagellar motor stator protein MotA [Bryobacteraceae bacterium]